MSGRKLVAVARLGELVVARREEPLDGLRAEDAFELLGERAAADSQRELLVDGEQVWSVIGGLRWFVRDDEIGGGDAGEQEQAERDGRRARRRAA